MILNSLNIFSSPFILDLLGKFKIKFTKKFTINIWVSSVKLYYIINIL